MIHQRDDKFSKVESDQGYRWTDHIQTYQTALIIETGLLWWLSGKESVSKAGDTGDTGSIPVLGRYPEKGNGNPP